MNCASCHRILGVLKYKGTEGKEYCSNACFEKLELTRSRFVGTTEEDMIQKTKTTPDAASTAAPKKNKMATPEEPKKKKKTAAPVEDTDVDPPGEVEDAPEPEAPKKKKKAAPVEETPEPEAPKKKKKAAQAEAAPEPEAPKKKKKAEAAAPKKASAIPASQTKVHGGHANPYRPGTLFAEVFARLSHGKKHTIEKLFDGLTAGDPRRVLSNMKDRGETTEAFTLTRNSDKTYTLTITATK